MLKNLILLINEFSFGDLSFFLDVLEKIVNVIYFIGLVIEKEVLI